MVIKEENKQRTESMNKKRSYSLSKGVPLLSQNSVYVSQYSKSPSDLAPIREFQNESSNENLEEFKTCTENLFT